MLTFDKRTIADFQFQAPAFGHIFFQLATPSKHPERRIGDEHMHPIFDGTKGANRHLKHQITLIGSHITWNVVIAHFQRFGINDEGLRIGGDTAWKIEEAGNVASALLPNTILQAQRMGRNHGIISSKGHLAWLPGGAGFGNERFDEVFVEVQVILMNDQLFVAFGDRRPLINFNHTLAMPRQQIALKQPQWFIQNPQIACWFSKGSDKRRIAENNPFHNESLQLKTFRPPRPFVLPLLYILRGLRTYKADYSWMSVSGLLVASAMIGSVSVNQSAPYR